MASEMANEFSGLPMSDLIGGPLNAACEAQIRLARTTAEFINTIGFNPVVDKDGKPVNGSDGKPQLVPRQVDFSFWRPVLSPPAEAITSSSSGTSGGTSGSTTSTSSSTGATNTVNNVEKVVLSVPFLAIVNVPALMVKSVDIVFDMEVKTSESSREDTTKEAGMELAAKGGWGPFSAELKIHGSISAHQEHTRSTDKSAKYHVEVQARDDGMPEGLSRVLDILQSAIAPVAVSKAVDPTKNNVATGQLGQLPA